MGFFSHLIEIVVDQEVVDPVVINRIVVHVLDRIVHLDQKIVEHDHDHVVIDKPTAKY